MHGIGNARRKGPHGGRHKCLTGDLKGARKATRKAFELNREYRAKFVEDEDFDAVWRTFG
jgi:hypothetical protein